MAEATTNEPATGVELAAIKDRMMSVLPHIRIAIEVARREEPTGKVGLATIVVLPDGGGRVTSRFEGDEFIADLERLFGIVPPTEADMELEVGAAKILAMLGGR